jgi:hypothetical protein
MKYLLSLLAIMPICAAAETVINYDDGSTYTVKEEEKIYISDKNVWAVTGGVSRGFFRTTLLNPHSDRDYVQTEPTGDEACWPWAGVAPPPGFSYEACVPEEEEESSCTDELGFGGAC